MGTIPTKPRSRKNASTAATPAPSVPIVTPRVIRGALAELLALGNFDERFAALLLQKNEVS